VESPISSQVAPADGQGVSSTPLYASLKRTLDCIGAALLSLLLAPLAVLTAVVVALDVGLPIVFWQQRPGRHGRRFRVYKFRTMRDSHDSGGNPVSESERLSRIGRFLRKTRLDELPQLYNILAGDMSFVGPRPLLAAEQGHVDRARLAVRPGLTGWAQVNGGRNISVEEKAALDLWYVKKMSAGLDASILIRTIVMLFKGDRANPATIRQAIESQTDGRAPASITHIHTRRREEGETSETRPEVGSGRRVAS
jgi:lipopolysaccharide/colanic/teichoic acid biosynthesis glycosyltransferase